MACQSFFGKKCVFSIYAIAFCLRIWYTDEKAALRRGYRKGGEGMYTIKDLAKACGVSIATVSRAFSPDARIAAGTRERILRQAEKMGYRPDPMARGLKGSRTQMIGVLVPSYANEVYLRQIQAIEKVLRAAEYRLLVAFQNEDAVSERESLQNMYLAPIDALIYTPQDMANRDLIEKLRQKIPLLQLYRSHDPSISGVLVDDVAGTERAVTELLQKGHRNIGFIGGGHRLEGYRSALQKYGIEPDASLVSWDWNVTEAEVSHFLLNAIHNHGMTAVLAVAGPAQLAWKCILTLAIPVPERLSFIMYDEVTWAEMFSITTVTHPTEEIARLCRDHLFAMLADPSAAMVDTVVPYLTTRSSVRELSTDV